MAIEGKRKFKLVGTVFSITGVVMVSLAGWTGIRQYHILKSWPNVEAEVVNSQVIRYHDAESGTTYRAAIDFRYGVEGKEYTAAASSSYSSSSYSRMKAKADAYATGTRHPVRYNPADPSDMRFEAGYNFSFFFLPGTLGLIGLTFSGLGGALLLGSRTVRELRCPSCGQVADEGQNFCPNCAATGGGLCRALQQRPPEWCNRLHHAEGHPRRASAGDPCRAGSEAGGGAKTAADSSPAGCVKNEKANLR
ncbi:MAG: DUF3592 domain-containing protein [Acidobacteria bacterium]|nr:DUF3592 domain-containing protein [Acidobacteriota bacterium]